MNLNATNSFGEYNLYSLGENRSNQREYNLFSPVENRSNQRNLLSEYLPNQHEYSLLDQADYSSYNQAKNNPLDQEFSLVLIEAFTVCILNAIALAVIFKVGPLLRNNFRKDSLAFSLYFISNALILKSNRIFKDDGGINIIPLAVQFVITGYLVFLKVMFQKRVMTRARVVNTLLEYKERGNSQKSDKTYVQELNNDVLDFISTLKEQNDSIKTTKKTREELHKNLISSMEIKKYLEETVLKTHKSLKNIVEKTGLFNNAHVALKEVNKNILLLQNFLKKFDKDCPKEESTASPISFTAIQKKSDQRRKNKRAREKKKEFYKKLQETKVREREGESCSIFHLEREENPWKKKCLELIETDSEKNTDNSSPGTSLVLTPFEKSLFPNYNSENKEEVEINLNLKRSGEFISKKYDKGKEKEKEKVKNNKQTGKTSLTLGQRDRLISAYKDIDSLKSTVSKISKENIHEETLLTKIYKKSLEYRLLRFTEAIFPTGKHKTMEEDKEFHQFLNAILFSVDRIHHLRNQIRSSYPIISTKKLLHFARKMVKYKVSHRIKKMLNLEKKREVFTPIDLSNFSLVKSTWEDDLNSKNPIEKDILLLHMLREEIEFISLAIKPFKDRQAELHFGGDVYLDAIKKSLSNISKIVSLLRDIIRSKLYSHLMFKSLIDWGNKVAHDIGEEVEIDIVVDEIPIGEIWELFGKDDDISEFLFKRIRLTLMELSLEKQ